MVRGSYLEGQGDVVSRFITPITHMEIPVIPIVYLLSPPDPPSKLCMDKHKTGMTMSFWVPLTAPPILLFFGFLPRLSLFKAHGS